MQTSPKKKNFRFRFRVRTLLAGLLIVACCAAWLGAYYRQSQVEQQLLKKFAATDITYGYQGEMSSFTNLFRGPVQNNKFGRPIKRSPPTPPGPKWLRRLLGEHCFARVQSFKVNGEQMNQEDFNTHEVSRFTELKGIEFSHCNFSSEDYLKLDNLTSIELLSFRNCNFNNVRNPPLVKNLKSIKFGYCKGITHFDTTKECENLRSFVLWETDVQFVQVDDALAYFRATTCDRLEVIKFPDTMPRITTLRLTDCKRLSNLELPQLTPKLERFTLGGNHSLKTLNLEDELVGCQGVMIEKCDALSSVTVPRAARYLGLHNLNSLVELKLPVDMSNLENLEVRRCPQLARLDSSGKFPKLSKFTISAPLLTVDSSCFSQSCHPSIDLAGCKAVTNLDTLVQFKRPWMFRLPPHQKVPSELEECIQPRAAMQSVRGSENGE